MKIITKLTGQSSDAPEPQTRSIRQGAHLETAKGKWVNVMVEDDGVAIQTFDQRVFIPTAELFALAETHAPGITKAPPPVQPKGSKVAGAGVRRL